MNLVPYSISFLAETTVFQNEINCHVSENDFNYTLNPSAMQWSGSVNTGKLNLILSGSEFNPYATTVGLYNDTDDLLVVGKLSTPYPVSPYSDMQFKIRWDS